MRFDIMGVLQKIGRSLMMPIAVLPAAALLLRFGASDMLALPVMEKAGDAVSRKPHARSGELLSKKGLLDKPERT